MSFLTRTQCAFRLSSVFLREEVTVPTPDFGTALEVRPFFCRRGTTLPLDTAEFCPLRPTSESGKVEVLGCVSEQTHL